jgi:hypothetical protein
MSQLANRRAYNSCLRSVGHALLEDNKNAISLFVSRIVASFRNLSGTFPKSFAYLRRVSHPFGRASSLEGRDSGKRFQHLGNKASLAPCRTLLGTFPDRVRFRKCIQLETSGSILTSTSKAAGGWTTTPSRDACSLWSSWRVLKNDLSRWFSYRVPISKTSGASRTRLRFSLSTSNCQRSPCSERPRSSFLASSRSLEADRMHFFSRASGVILPE